MTERFTGLESPEMSLLLRSQRERERERERGERESERERERDRTQSDQHKLWIPPLHVLRPADV